MSGEEVRVDPGAIMDMSTAFWRSQVLLTANRMGVFECLAEGPLALDDLCARLGTQPRPTRLLLNAMVALDLARKDTAGFANSVAGAAFLVPGGPGYLGNAIRYSDNLYATWGRLQEALRSGEPQLAAEAYTGDDAKLTRDFVYAMHDRALGIARVLVELVDLGGRKHLLDVGGGPGTYASMFAQRFADLRATVLDLPGVIAHASEIIASLGVGDRVDTLAGSYHEIPFPKGNDAVLISGVLHRESPEGCAALIAKAADCLDRGGLLVISDVFADAGGAGPEFATLFGLNMMLTAPNGGVHADQEIADCMRTQGFGEIGIVPFPPPLPHRIVTGVR